MQAIRTAKNKAEPIIDHTPAEPFKSPLQIYVMNNCEHCDHFKGICRLEDSRGLTPMSLCIALYTHQVPVDFGEILKLSQPQPPKPAALKELQEAETRDDA
jgi:hypothetical protein